MLKFLYWFASCGWLIHFGYWAYKRRQYKKGLLTAEDMCTGLFIDYTVAVLSLVMLCLIGTYGVYLGGL